MRRVAAPEQGNRLVEVMEAPADDLCTNFTALRAYFRHPSRRHGLKPHRRRRGAAARPQHIMGRQELRLQAKAVRFIPATV